MTDLDELQNLADLCREIRDWRQSGTLRDGKIREMSKPSSATGKDPDVRATEDTVVEQVMDYVISLAARAAIDDMSFAVKPLEWTPIRDGAFLRAESLRFVYEIPTSRENLAELQAAAQADYDSKIRSVLTRPILSPTATRDVLLEIANRAGNMSDDDAADWLPSIYKLACEAAGRDPWPVLKAHGYDPDTMSVSFPSQAPISP